MVRCPKRMSDGMARDACVAEQARRGVGCGGGCLAGPAAIEERVKLDEEEAREEDVREAVRARHRMYYRLYERKLPPEKVNKSPRPPVPGGRGPRLAAHR
jgi:hypothetical protein